MITKFNVAYMRHLALMSQTNSTYQFILVNWHLMFGYMVNITIYNHLMVAGQLGCQWSVIMLLRMVGCITKKYYTVLPGKWLLVLTSPCHNVNRPKRRQMRRWQTKTWTGQKFGRPKRRYSKASWHQTQTKMSTTRNVDKTKHRKTKPSTDRKIDKYKFD